LDDRKQCWCIEDSCILLPALRIGEAKRQLGPLAAIAAVPFQRREATANSLFHGEHFLIFVGDIE
jgi:hypothetical protein